MISVAEALAEYVVDLQYEDLPENIVDMSKKCFLDSLGNIYCGRYTKMGEQILDYLTTYSQLTIGEAQVSLIGGDSVSKEDALMAHAVMARCTDLDDGHRYAMGHPGSVVIPAVLTAGELKKCDTKQMLTAICAAYDVYCRIGAAINPTSYRERGFDATGIVGAVACAAAIGKLYGLNKEKMKNALGISALFSGGLIEYQNDGTMGKVLCGCWAVKNGLEAVQLAEKGFTGPEHAFEGPKGFVQAFSNEPKVEDILLDLGEDFKIKETYFKKHACMRGLHAAVDAILELREKEHLRMGDIETIEVQTTPFVGRLSKKNPTTLIAAQCSLEFVLAVAMKEGHISNEEMLSEALKQEDIFALASRIHLKMDDKIDLYVKQNPSHWAAVNLVICTKDGRVLNQWTPLPGGEAEKPFEWNQLYEKFEKMLLKTPYAPYVKQLYNQIYAFENLSELNRLYAPWDYIS